MSIVLHGSHAITVARSGDVIFRGQDIPGEFPNDAASFVYGETLVSIFGCPLYIRWSCDINDQEVAIFDEPGYASVGEEALTANFSKDPGRPNCNSAFQGAAREYFRAKSFWTESALKAAKSVIDDKVWPPVATDEDVEEYDEAEGGIISRESFHFDICGSCGVVLDLNGQQIKQGESIPSPSEIDLDTDPILYGETQVACGSDPIYIRWQYDLNHREFEIYSEGAYESLGERSIASFDGDTDPGQPDCNLAFYTVVRRYFNEHDVWMQAAHDAALSVLDSGNWNPIPSQPDTPVTEG